MSALYRKYRPQKFEDVIAQQHITRTLVNQIEKGKITHAYLFTGSRGTGKTTCARIFARAINCLSPENGSPCGKCEVCKALSGGNIDIIELDAASNNGVDQIREIVDNVAYPPVAGKYKVYIVDEVHMLSGAAFNALLKTLEEPPAHAVFVLATTEVHKLPATVLSRCMRFDFRLVPAPVLKEHLKKIYAAEGVKAEDSALDLIVAAAEGSVRDMLSVADRCMNYSDNLSYGDVLGVLGATGRESTRSLLGAIARSDVGATLGGVNEACSAGKSVGLIAKDLCSYARDLLVLKTVPSDGGVLGSADEIEKMRLEAQNYSADFLVSVVNIFSAADTELRYSVSPRIALECAALKAARLASLDLSAIEERLTRIERKLESGAIAAPSAPDVSHQSHAPANKPMDARSVWGRITTYFRLNESPRALGLLGSVEEVELSGNKLVLWASPENFLQVSADDMIAALSRALSADGCGFTPVVNKRSGAVDMDSEINKIKKMIGDAKLNVR